MCSDASSPSLGRQEKPSLNALQSHVRGKTEKEGEGKADPTDEPLCPQHSYLPSPTSMSANLPAA